MIRPHLQAATLAICLCLPMMAHAQDLEITSATAPSSGSTAQAGSLFKVQFTVANGSITTTSTFYVAYYFCQAVTTPQASCQYLSRDAISGGLGAGASKTVTSYSNLQVPTSAEYGTGYVRFVADYLGHINETNENNNDRYGAIMGTSTPDLIISLFQATLSEQTVDYLLVVCNQGDATKENIGLELYYNPSGTPGCTTTADQSWTISGGLPRVVAPAAHTSAPTSIRVATWSGPGLMPTARSRRRTKGTITSPSLTPSPRCPTLEWT